MKEKLTYNHSKYGDVFVSLSEEFNEYTKENEVQAAATYYKEEEVIKNRVAVPFNYEDQVLITYIKKENLTHTEIQSRLNKKIV